MASPSSVLLIGFMTFLIMTLCSSPSQAQLSDETFYALSCPAALATISTTVTLAVLNDTRMAASLIRLHFHDCFVQGCDASVLLDDTPSMIGEKTSIFNDKSLRGFEVIDNIKSQLRSLCPGVVSCADIVAAAARYASVAVGGPTWSVNLGRRDSLTASKTLADSSLPRFTDSVQQLTDLFASKNLTQRHMVALSGSHTVGQAHCATFRDRVNSNTSDIDSEFGRSLREDLPCPADGSGDGNLAPMDLVTPNTFDNSFFRNLVNKKGLLQSDQVLFSGGATDSIVMEYVNNAVTFRSDFAAAMVQMGKISPLTGTQGQIRTFCNVVN
uniref:Peroxidase n=1 Tax=Manihot esculenta TaxID=3983 RepID=A0A2C9WCV5_MANES